MELSDGMVSHVLSFRVLFFCHSFSFLFRRISWGEGSVGRLGYGNGNDLGKTNGSMASCIDIDLGSDFDAVTTISVGNVHSCALSNNNSIACWGMVSDSISYLR